MRKHFTPDHLLLIILLIFVQNRSWSQVNISVGNTVSQTFDGIGNTATATLPSGWRVDNNVTTVRTVGSYGSAGTTTTQAGSTSISTSATNGIYNFGSSSLASDRAVGGLSSGTASRTINLYVDLINNGSGSISSLNISYNVEKYRNGINPAGFSIQMYFSFDGLTWTNAGSNFLTSFPADADNLGSTVVPIAATPTSNKILSASVNPGSHLYLAWNYSVTTGTTTTNAQGFGVDDVQISATGAALSNNANLSGLSLSAGTLTPSFTSENGTYSASVHNSVSSIQVTPTASQTKATIKVNGNTVVSGTASPSIALATGNNIITTEVTAEDGVTAKTYTTTINRADQSVPVLSVSSSLAGFTNTCIGKTSLGSFTLVGNELDGSNITIGPLSAFSFSESADGLYSNTLSFSYTEASFTGKVIYVQFAPSSVQSYNGNISVSGGGASALSILATGSGVNTPPSVATGLTSNISGNSAIAIGSVTANGCGDILSYGIEYSTASGFSNGTQITSTNINNGTYSTPLTSLAANTAYYYKAFVTSSGGTTYGSQQPFTTTAFAVPMASQEDLTYIENFSSISTWSNGFTSGTGANHFSPLAIQGTAAIPNPTRVTTSTTTFASGTSGGVQKGSGNIILLATGGTDNSNSTAVDLTLDFTGVNAGTISFDWAQVFNSSGDRNGSLRVYASPNGTDFPELTSAAVLNITNNVASNGSIAKVTLPTTFNNNPKAMLRFYYYNGVGGITPTGSRPKISIDNLAITAISTMPCVTPSAQPTNLTFGAITETSIQGTFTAASPTANKYLVIMSQNSSLTSNPVDGQVYQVGDDIGDGDVIAYTSGTTFTASGLSGGTNYNFFIFSVNNACLGGPKYLTVGELVNNATTLAGIPPCTAPEEQPSALTLMATTNSIQGGFAAVAADEYLVLRSTSPYFSTNPVNGTSYNTGNILGNAVVVERNSTNSFTASSLASDTKYYFFVFGLNSQNCINGPVYNVVNPLIGEFSTLPLSPCTTPQAQPTNLSLNASNSSIVGTFNNSASADNYLVIASTSASLTSIPTDNVDYNIGSDFGGGKVISNSSSTSFVAVNLNAATTYYIYVFASNKNCTGGTKYLTASPLTASIKTTSTPAYQVYFGTLHAHSDYSDGNKDKPGYTPADNYNYALTAECMDFLGISEHNHFSSVNNPGNIITDYRKGSMQAKDFNVKHPNFLALYGMEWGVISGGGHVVVYGDGMDKLFGWETNVGGVSGNNYDVYVAKSDYTGPNGLFKTINDHIGNNTFGTLAHPNSTDFNNLSNSAYNIIADDAIVGSAVASGPANSTNTTYSNPGASMSHLWYYQKLLSKGFHLGPTIDHDNHNTTFGKTTRARTAVLAPSLTQSEFVKAMREMRFYATEDCDARVDFTINTRVMGSVFSDRNAPAISVKLSDPTTATTSAKIRIMFGVPGSGVLPVAIDSIIGDTYNFVDNNLAVNTTGFYYADIENAGAKIITSPIWYTRICTIATDTIVTACNSFTWNGQTYTSSTTDSRQFITSGGCDSIATLHLTISTPTSGDTTATVCESFTWYGVNYATSGQYSHVLTNKGVCDSIVTLHLTINSKPEASITAGGSTSFCPGGSVDLTANEATSYLWSNGLRTRSISVRESGNYFVTITDGNNCSNTSSPVQVLSIDETAPIVRTQNVTIQLGASGEASITTSQINNGSTDNCGIGTSGFTLSKSSFNCSDIGENLVTLTVTDVNGNSATGEVTVTVIDNIAPTFTPPASRNILLVNDCTVTIPDLLTGLHGSDNCGDISFTQLPIGGTSITSSHNQLHTVTITAEDGHNNRTSQVVKLTAKDETNPSITAPASVTVNTDAGQCSATNVNLGTPTYSDNCSGTTINSNAPATFEKGTTTVTWTVIDAAGNKSFATQIVTVLDKEKPPVTTPVVPVQCYNATGSYTVPELSATDNCEISTVTYSITGVTRRNGSGRNASGQFNEGTSTITWTVTDGSGNVSTSTTSVVINPRITISIPDVYAVSPGGSPNTIYNGYGPTSLTLNSNVSGGTAPYSYKWTVSAPAGPAQGTNSTFTISPSTTTTYSLTLKDAYSCAATPTLKTIELNDVRCGAKSDKVTVCILQKGSYTNSCVTSSSVANYLSNGALLGVCPINATTKVALANEAAKEIKHQTLSARALPNPSSYAFNIVTKSDRTEAVNLRVLTASGSVVEVRRGLQVNKSISLGANYTPGTYYAEIQQGTNRVVLKLVKQPR